MAKSRIHHVQEGRYARFTAESKFERKDTRISTADALAEGNDLRKKLAGRRILLDVRRDSDLTQKV